MNSFIDQLTPVQALECGKFAGKHHKSCSHKAGAVGGTITYMMTPTGLGIIYSVKCNVCGKELTLNTDDLD